MLVGINAEAGSGKSTVADGLLVKDHGFVAVAFADELKRICARVYGFSRKQLWGSSALRNAPDKRYQQTCKACHGRDDCTALSASPCYDCNNKFSFLTPRQALQELGDWGRALYLNTWVDVTLRDIDSLLGTENARYTPWEGVYDVLGMGPGYAHVVVPDVRYKNEMAAIRAKGGKLIRIKGIHQAMPDRLAGHSSEQEQKEVPDGYFDSVIANDSNLPTLFKQVQQALGLGV